MSFSIKETKILKGVAILLLIFHHMYLTPDEIVSRGAKPTIFDMSEVSQVAACFRICVFIFAFISAYGLATKIVKLNDGYLRYFIRRYIKLVAPYSFTLVCLWIFYYVMYGKTPLDSYGGSILYMFEDLFSVLELGGHTDKMLSGVFWYMNFAIYEIVIMPIVVVLIQKIGCYVLVLTAFFFGTLPIFYDSMYGGNYNSYLFVIEIGAFFALNGTFEKMFGRYTSLSSYQKITISVLSLVLSYIGPFMAINYFETEIFGLNSIMYTIGAISLICFVYLCITNTLLCTILEKLGDISGDIYLLHVIIFRTAWRIVSSTSLIVIQYIIVIILCILIAYILKFMKEKTGYNKLISYVVKKI